jgi:hypothetical protein
LLSKSKLQIKNKETDQCLGSMLLELLIVANRPFQKSWPQTYKVSIFKLIKSIGARVVRAGG